MWTYAKHGWTTARRCWFLLLLLFLYQYLWGFFLFKYVKSIVVPLLYRYPGSELGGFAERLFWLEAEFQLTKTNLIIPYIWALGLFVLIRMMATPFINCGIYHALTQGGSHRKAFFAGIKSYYKPFLLLYALQTVVIFAPLAWVVPQALDALAKAGGNWTSAAASILPYIVGWLAYQGLVELVFMYVGFGIVGGQKGWAPLSVFARKSYVIVGLSLTIFGIAGFISLTVTALSIWWAGFVAMLLHQLFPVVRALLKLWSISTQHHIWSAHRPS